MARLDVTEMFHGIAYPGHLHTQESLQHALKFPFRDTDILIASYPKSGTTWIQEMLSLILNKGDPHLSLTVPNWARAPWLEHYYCASVLEGSSTTPRIVTTHLPHHLLGSALTDSKAKVIYVSRNPKDVLVSFYHFHKMANFLPESGTFPEFVNRFLAGTLHFGSWFDHFKGWTSQMTPMHSRLHMTYEEMSLDLHGAIKKVSSFIQCPLVEDEVNNCVQYCSFSQMKDNVMVNYSLVPDDIMDHNRGRFMRKGQMGDWKNMFTEEQNRYFEQVLKFKMQGCTTENCEKSLHPLIHSSDAS
ncbi:sulfotransferase family 5A, member 1 [Echeneis naucrates]|uniref:Sulfotransferase n=1 Tax=Echeneis naucrates TaxID=173247 RepID=A0A665TJQ5_ECHNA|nr:sulfotransferase family cytosolic 2B member 1-like [Echeneis naucrates]